MNNNNFNKPLEEVYPNLCWDKSFSGILDICDTEKQCTLYFVKKYSYYIKIWEYGYYFISLLIQRSSVHKSYAPLAALYSEAHSSLRCSFLCNVQGYHPEAISLLRRVHECCTKLIACRSFPKNIWNIVQSTSLQKAESDLGLNLKWIYNIESSFLHSNKLKVFDTGFKLKENLDISIPYGPQLNDKEYSTAAAISIFWMYVLVLVAPRLFPDQIPSLWMNKYKESYMLLRDYISMPAESKLIKEAENIEKILDKIGPESYRDNKD